MTQRPGGDHCHSFIHFIDAHSENAHGVPIRGAKHGEGLSGHQALSLLLPPVLRP